MSSLSLSLSRSLSRSHSQSSHTRASGASITRKEAYHLCHTPTLSIPGGRVVANPHYIGPAPAPTPTPYVVANKWTSTSKEYQRTGVRPRPAKLDREAGLSTKSFVPIVSVDFDNKDAKVENDKGMKTPKERKLNKNVRFSDTILVNKFDLEDEDSDEDIYSALCTKIQREREREEADLTTRVWWKGKAGVKGVKKTLKVFWNVIY
ncbi:hypothetical protein E1B28_003508 [Marasmius oreades]|uniref:Uncharacterized protein n=1 Tax=Marasmius oreades TaxID=181124 RepID=A0A9P7UKY0_9AGAR|nr:uncharacterized protein E1B28_003508 [Marasmius oreades]KAG7085985.1 hypothetical protein E1B28_003508 [Marasmius oreades]